MPARFYRENCVYLKHTYAMAMSITYSKQYTEQNVGR